MRFNFASKSLRYTLRALLFVGAVVLVYECIPHQIKFDKQFMLGKPWPNELLTAEFDFPIYKDESELKHEQDSILRYLVPYFTINQDVARAEIEKFSRAGNSLTDNQRRQIADALTAFYRTGIMSAQDYNDLQTMGVTRISIIDSTQTAHETALTDIHTARSAYDALGATNIDAGILRKANLNHYLTANLTLDKNKSEQVKQELLASISPTAGMVQAGQRIIDRGEIIDYQTYKILRSLKIATEQMELPERNSNWIVAGKILLIVGLLLLFFLYLRLFRPRIFNSNRDILFIMLMVVSMVGLASLTVHFTQLSIYIVPFALLPIIVRTFFDSRTALFAHIITVLVTSFMVPQPFEFLLLQITAGMTVVSSLKEMTQRSQFVRTALFVFISYSITYTSFVLIYDASFDKIDWWIFAIFAVNSLLQMIAYALIFIFEKIFGFLSNMTLVELSNVNNKLLMEFSGKAPGTFQHALQVSNLAAAAAARINANTLLARTGALYHDIGKMVNPLYFTENQTSGINPLNEAAPEDAAQIIIAHVANGVKIADKNKLPDRIKAFILTHHAENKTGYFYNMVKNSRPDADIDESKFTYPGPKPGSKETTIVMMADAVEAASRSLKTYDDKSIDELVDRIIDGQITNGSFQNSPIAFRDVEQIKNVFKDKLKSIYHSRVSYPELNNTTTKKR